MRHSAASSRARTVVASRRTSDQRSLPGTVQTGALFGKDVRTLASAVGRQHQHDDRKAREVLARQPRPLANTVLDCAKSLLSAEVVGPS